MVLMSPQSLPQRASVPVGASSPQAESKPPAALAPGAAEAGALAHRAPRGRRRSPPIRNRASGTAAGRVATQAGFLAPACPRVDPIEPPARLADRPYVTKTRGDAVDRRLARKRRSAHDVGRLRVDAEQLRPSPFASDDPDGAVSERHPTGTHVEPMDRSTRAGDPDENRMALRRSRGPSSTRSARPRPRPPRVPGLRTCSRRRAAQARRSSSERASCSRRRSRPCRRGSCRPTRGARARQPLAGPLPGGRGGRRRRRRFAPDRCGSRCSARRREARQGRRWNQSPQSGR